MNKLKQIENLCSEAMGENRLQPPIFKGLVCRGYMLNNSNGGCGHCERCKWYQKNPIKPVLEKFELIEEIRKILHSSKL